MWPIDFWPNINFFWPQDFWADIFVPRKVDVEISSAAVTTVTLSDTTRD